MHKVMYVQMKYYDEHELETLRGSSSPEVGTNWNRDVLNFFPSFRQIGLRLASECSGSRIGLNYIQLERPTYDRVTSRYCQRTFFALQLNFHLLTSNMRIVHIMRGKYLRGPLPTM